MRVDYIKEHKKEVIITIILLLGLAVSAYLIQNPKIFKSRANQELYNIFTINQIDESGNSSQLSCDGNNCNIDSLDVEIKADIEELERLSQE